MVKLIATKPLPYGGVRYKAGEPFEATRKHARVLIAIGKAEKAPEAPNNPVLFESRPVEPVSEGISPRTGLPKRQYRRRDIRPESLDPTAE